MLTKSNLRISSNPTTFFIQYPITTTRQVSNYRLFKKPFYTFVPQHIRSYTIPARSKMASNPPGACCYQGVRHEGTPTGDFSKLGDFEIYTKYPENKSTDYGVLVITDVIGHRFNNAQLIADQFAANGYFVMMPDLFYGDPISLNRPSDFDLMKWMKGEYNEKKISHLPPVVDPIIDSCLVEMRTKYNCKKIGAVGYCFGAKYVVRHLLPGSKKIDAGFTAHPSFVEVAELQDMKGPLAIAAAETDSIFPTEKRHETEEILKKLGLPYQINLYAGVEHGFAVRGDMKDPKARYAKESAFLMACQWFEEHLKGGAGNKAARL